MSVLSALAWRVPNRQQGSFPDDRDLVRHIHDLEALESVVATDARFPDLVITSMNQDSERAKNIPAFSLLSNAEKFQKMLDILEHDVEYLKAYDRFVKSVSYAPSGTESGFAQAISAVKRLIKIVLAAFPE